MKKEHMPISVSSEISLAELLDLVKSRGSIRLAFGNDVYVIAHENDGMPERAREFLIKGGVLDTE